MSEEKTIASRNADISKKLLDSLYLIETLEDLYEAEAKAGTILEIVRKNIDFAFNEIEKCRKIISPAEAD